MAWMRERIRAKESEAEEMADPPAALPAEGAASPRGEAAVSTET